MFALDSNVIIDFLNKKSTVVAALDSAVYQKVPLAIPSFVEYEISRGFLYCPSKQKEMTYKQLRIRCRILETNAAIWRCAASIWASLRHAGRTLGDADILIAACCLVNGYTLVTHNTKDFVAIATKSFDELRLIDWI